MVKRPQANEASHQTVTAAQLQAAATADADAMENDSSRDDSASMRNHRNNIKNPGDPAPTAQTRLAAYQEQLTLHQSFPHVVKSL